MVVVVVVVATAAAAAAAAVGVGVVVVSANGAVHVVIKFVCLFLKAVAGSYAGRVDAEEHQGRRLSFGDGVLAGRGLGRQRICAAASARRNTSTWTAAGNREGQSEPRCQGF